MNGRPVELDSVRPVADLDALMRRRLEALKLEVRAIEVFLGVEAREKVICPQCRRERNKSA